LLLASLLNYKHLTPPPPPKKKRVKIGGKLESFSDVSYPYKTKYTSTDSLLHIFDNIGYLYYGSVAWGLHLKKAITPVLDQLEKSQRVTYIFQTFLPLEFGLFPRARTFDESFTMKFNSDDGMQKIERLNRIKSLDLADLITLAFLAADKEIEDILCLLRVNDNYKDIPLTVHSGDEYLVEEDKNLLDLLFKHPYTFEVLSYCSGEECFLSLLKKLINRNGYEKIFQMILEKPNRDDFYKEQLRIYCLVKILCVAIEERNNSFIKKAFFSLEEFFFVDFKTKNGCVQKYYLLNEIFHCAATCGREAVFSLFFNRINELVRIDHKHILREIIERSRCVLNKQIT
jgi:hypothetical protein